MGAVQPQEHVARLLHTKIAIPEQAAFTRKELAGEGSTTNECGKQSGCSVDRIDGLAEQEIADRAIRQAELKVGRKSEGALIASVNELRSIQHSAAPQAVMVYDDARLDNERHAVIRVHASVPKTDFPLVRRDIIRAFNTLKIEPVQGA